MAARHHKSRRDADTFTDLERPRSRILAPFDVAEDLLDAANECEHGRLPADRNKPPECRCWRHLTDDSSLAAYLKARAAARRL